MKISTKGRYSLRVMLDLAQHAGEGFISLKTIADRQGISKQYLDQIMLVLNKTDFLKTAKGAHGGYMLAKAPEKYTAGGILRLVEGSIAPMACVEKGGRKCKRRKNCIARHVWLGLDDAISDYLDKLTLQDILDKNSVNLLEEIK